MTRGDDRAAILDRLVGDIGAGRDELAALALRLGDMADLSGSERPIADAVAAWFAQAGIPSEVQPLSETSANVVAWVPHDRPAIPALILSSHLDTEAASRSGPATFAGCGARGRRASSWWARAS
jgi:hypothetical protein